MADKETAKKIDRKSENEHIEKQLWKAADKLRKNIDAAEYKHVVLGLIFLKYISGAFEDLFERLKNGKGDYAGADPGDRDEYKAENVFFVPPSARWTYLQKRAKLLEIGKDVDAAMDAIERVRELDYVLTPGRYVGLPDDEDDSNVLQNLKPSLKSSLKKKKN